MTKALFAAFTPLAIDGWGARHWYQSSGARLVEESRSLGIDPERYVSIVAITSPRVSVARNMVLARAYVAGQPLPMLQATRAALSHYESTGEIRGPKTSAFAAALLGDLSAVVIDTWIMQAAGVASLTVSVRRAIDTATRSVASYCGLEPSEAQAAIWEGARIAANRPRGVEL